MDRMLPGQRASTRNNANRARRCRNEIAIFVFGRLANDLSNCVRLVPTKGQGGRVPPRARSACLNQPSAIKSMRIRSDWLLATSAKETANNN